MPLFANARVAAALARLGGGGKRQKGIAWGQFLSERSACLSGGAKSPHPFRMSHELRAQRYVIYICVGMDFDYDPEKDAANRAKHGLPLAFGRRAFDDPGHIVLASFRPIDGEDRYKTVGRVDGKLFTAVYVWRGETIRLISVRRSNDGEQRAYHRNSG